MARKAMPAPRPALKKAPDSGLHPALVVPGGEVCATEGLGAAKKKVTKGPAGSKATKKKVSAKKVSAKARSKSSNSKGSKRQAKGRSGSLLGAGKATSDSIIVKKSGDRNVQLRVSIPKPLRKEIRRRAAKSGMSVDDFVTDVMTVWLGDGRWW